MMIACLKKHLPFLAMALGLHLLLTLTMAYLNNWYDPPISATSDLAIHIPRAFKLANPDLYSRDPVFADFNWDNRGRLDHFLFAWLLYQLFPLLGGLRPTLIVLSVLLWLVFVVSVYIFTYGLTHNELAAIIAVFLASIDYRGLGGIQLGFAPEYVLPRNFVVVISPLIFLLFIRWRTSRKIWLLYGALGLMANFHALVALHLVVILTLAWLLTAELSLTWLGRASGAGLATLICALPVIFSYGPTVSSAVSVSVADAPMLLRLYDYVVRPLPAEIWLFWITFLPMALLGGVGFWWLGKRQIIPYETFKVYLILYLIILLLPWLGLLINRFTLAFTQLELLRVTRYYFLFNFMPIAILLGGWLQARQRAVRLAVPVLLVTLIFLTRIPVGALLIRTGLNWVGREQVAQAAPQEETDNPERPWRWQTFADLCRWAETNTPVDALFLTSTDWRWGHFWIYARRSLAVAFKGTSWPGWTGRYLAVEQLYAQPEPEKFAGFAQTHRIDYVITSPAITLPQWEVVYENEDYAVYQVSDRP